jgi:hypothetical protein
MVFIQSARCQENAVDNAGHASTTGVFDVCFVTVSFECFCVVCMCATEQIIRWFGHENQAPIRMSSTAKDIALLLDLPPIRLNNNNDRVRLRAGAMKCDRLAIGSFFGFWLGASKDRYGMIETIIAAWGLFYSSCLTPPRAFLTSERYKHYLLTVNDIVLARRDPEQCFLGRVPHQGIFGQAIEVCVLSC